jgi:hypothetical protein
MPYHRAGRSERFAALDFGELGNDAPIAAVKVGRKGLALRLDPPCQRDAAVALAGRGSPSDTQMFGSLCD